MARANAFWPTAVVGEADSVSSVSASACHIGGPMGVSPGELALVYGNQLNANLLNFQDLSQIKDLCVKFPSVETQQTMVVWQGVLDCLEWTRKTRQTTAPCTH